MTQINRILAEIMKLIFKKEYIFVPTQQNFKCE